MKYYVTADIHGFYTEFHKALDETGYFTDPEPHKLIISIAKNEQSSPTYRKDDTHGIDSPHNENPPQHPQV